MQRREWNTFRKTWSKTAARQRARWRHASSHFWPSNINAVKMESRKLIFPMNKEGERVRGLRHETNGVHSLNFLRLHLNVSLASSSFNAWPPGPALLTAEWLFLPVFVVFVVYQRETEHPRTSQTWGQKGAGTKIEDVRMNEWSDMKRQYYLIVDLLSSSQGRFS